MAVKKTNRSRPVRVISGNARYLVRVGADPRFLVRLDPSDGRPLVAQAPSTAWHGSYAEADAICEQLREKDYIAVVTDIYGRAVDYEALESEREKQQDRITQFWGE